METEKNSQLQVIKVFGVKKRRQADVQPHAKPRDGSQGCRPVAAAGYVVQGRGRDSAFNAQSTHGGLAVLAQLQDPKPYRFLQFHLLHLPTSVLPIYVLKIPKGDMVRENFFGRLHDNVRILQSTKKNTTKRGVLFGANNIVSKGFPQI